MNCADIADLAPRYVAGELDAQRAAEFDAHLKICPACMQKLEEQARIDARLREALLAEEVDVAVVNRRVRELIAAESTGSSVVRFRPEPRRWLAVTAGVAAVLLLLAAGYLFIPGRTAPVYADAATDHRHEIVEHQPRPWLIDQEKINGLLERHGIAAGSVPLVLAKSYQLREAKVCWLDGRSFVHLVYSDGDDRFSLYLRPRDGHSMSGPIRGIANGRLLRVSSEGHEHISSFQTSRLTVIVVTDLSADASLRLARAASAAL